MKSRERFFHILGVLLCVLGTLSITLSIMVAIPNRFIYKLMTYVSPDGHITQGGINSLKVASVRLRFLGIFLLLTSMSLFRDIRILLLYLVKNLSNKLSHFWSACISFAKNAIRSQIIGIASIIYLCIMLTLGIKYAPFSNDEGHRFTGAVNILTKSTPVCCDAGGYPISIYKHISIVRYIPAMCCILLNKGLICTKILYAVFCLVCVILVGYVGYRAFDALAANLSIFIMSLPTFVHETAVDAARTEFLAAIFLLLGIMIIYLLRPKSPWYLALGCILIGFSVWVKDVLLILIPSFIVTGLILCIKEGATTRNVFVTIGPVISIILFEIIDFITRAVFLGIKVMVCHFYHVWFVSSIYDMLTPKSIELFSHKMSIINKILPFPILLGIIAATGYMLMKAKKVSAVRIFAFSTTVIWIIWWLVFDPFGYVRHLLIGFLFFSLIMGDFCSQILRQKGHNLMQRIENMLVAWKIIMVSILIMFGIMSLINDFLWLKWAIPVRKGQELLAQYVINNKDRILFCSWGSISAYEITALSGVPLWDISKGFPPDSLQRGRKLYLIVSAWMERMLDIGFGLDLPEGEKKLIHNNCKFVKDFGGTSVYELFE